MEFSENDEAVSVSPRSTLKMSSNTCSTIVLRLILLILTVVSFREVQGHVALTFPRARKYDLDFLDNARTPGPCGMPRGECFLYNYHLYRDV